MRSSRTFPHPEPAEVHASTLPDSPDYQTIAGFLLHRLGTVPRPGTVTTAGGYRFTIVEMDGPRIMKVRAEPEPPGQPGS